MRPLKSDNHSHFSSPSLLLSEPPHVSPGNNTKSQSEHGATRFDSKLIPQEYRVPERNSRTARNDATAARVRELFDYNPKTGHFYHGQGRNFGRLAATKQTNGYIKIAIDGVSYLAHRVAWLYVHGYWPENVIDHINGDKSDNRITNLRDVTQQQNVDAYRARQQAALSIDSDQSSLALPKTDSAGLDSDIGVIFANSAASSAKANPRKSNSPGAASLCADQISMGHTWHLAISE